MFYTQLFTSMRGPIAKIWLAAHWEKKITKAHVFECNLENTIQELISPQVKIGLRTSGHLLLGVVRIYFRKTKYLLADCSDAVLKIRVAFRPGQTDFLIESLEATYKAITLPEDFTDFSTKLPDINSIEVVDHFFLNQCRAEDITLKEDLGNSFIVLQSDFGEESRLHQGGLFDVSFPNLATPGDGFGDEDLGVDFLDFIGNSTEGLMSVDFTLDDTEKDTPQTPPPTAVSLGCPSMPSHRPEAPTQEETLLVNCFALEPVSAIISSEKKGVNRKRRLLVDLTKELSNEEIRDQLANAAELLCPLDIAPPTCQLMEWKETGSKDTLFRNHCVPRIHPHLQQLSPRDLFPWQSRTVEDVGGCVSEQIRSQKRLRSESSRLKFGGDSILLNDSQDGGSTMSSLHETLQRTHSRHSAPDPRWEPEGSQTEAYLLGLSSENSMFVNPSVQEMEPLQTRTQTQSALDSQDFEERRISSRAQELLRSLRAQSCRDGTAVFSLLELNGRCNRMQASTTFFCFLVLKKQKALELRQDTPFADIIATPGLTFHQL